MSISNTYRRRNLKIGISRLYYNEYDAIRKTHPDQCKVQYVDGRFPAFTKINDSDFSTDGSNELIAKFKNAERFEFFGSLNNKLNYGFKIAKEFDVMIILSCDEYLIGDIEEFLQELKYKMRVHPDQKIFNLPFKVVSGDDRPLKSKDRIFIDPSNWSVGKNHWEYLYKGKPQKHRQWFMEADITSLKIIHDDGVRETTRNKLMTQYQKIPEEIADNYE